RRLHSSCPILSAALPIPTCWSYQARKASSISSTATTSANSGSTTTWCNPSRIKPLPISAPPHFLTAASTSPTASAASPKHSPSPTASSATLPPPYPVTTTSSQDQPLPSPPTALLTVSPGTSSAAPGNFALTTPILMPASSIPALRPPMDGIVWGWESNSSCPPSPKATSTSPPARANPPTCSPSTA